VVFIVDFLSVMCVVVAELMTKCMKEMVMDKALLPE
jgi:hypothetical protein